MSKVTNLAYDLWIAGQRISPITNQLQHFKALEKKTRESYLRMARLALKYPFEPTCIKCGCTEFNACPEGCSWIFIGGVTDNWGLCSACFEQLGLDMPEARKGRGGKRK